MLNRKIIINSIVIFLFSISWIHAQTYNCGKNDIAISLTYTLFSDWFGHEKQVLKDNYSFYHSPHNLTYFQTQKNHFGINYIREIKNDFFIGISYNYLVNSLQSIIDTNTIRGFIKVRKINILAVSFGYTIKITKKPLQKLSVLGGVSYINGEEIIHLAMIKHSVTWNEFFDDTQKFNRIGILAGINYKLYLYKGLNFNLFGNYHNDFSKVYFFNTGFGFGYSF
jgi:hypothetical protein